MRIIAGILKGKTIIAPENGTKTRPTSDRARESLFNILTSLFLKRGIQWSNVTFADVFAGSGAIGLEAYSRGAKEVFCFENDPIALKALQKNCQDIKNIHIIKRDALLPLSHEAVSILFMDPPYQKGLWEKAIPIFQKTGWIGVGTLLIVETDKNSTYEIPKGYVLLQKRSQGRNTFLFMMKGKENGTEL